MNEIRKERTRDLFIQIACELIRKEGVEAATIRNIANKAGYNSATLYSYFDNQAHLLFCAYMKFEEELLEIMKDEVKKSDKTLNEIWGHMYIIMAKYYFDNPNIFECSYVTVYDKEGSKKRQEQREKESVLNQYVLECLQMVAQEKKIPLPEIMQINGLCFSLTIGTVLLALKDRVGDKSEETLLQLEANIQRLLSTVC